MISPRLLLAAGTAAATVASIGPLAVQSGSARVSPLQVEARGLTVSVANLRGGAPASATLVVPAGTTVLSGVASGTPALEAKTKLTVVRSSDGAMLFTGSLATFHSLPVQVGVELQVSVQTPAGYDGLKAGAVLQWA